MSYSSRRTIGALAALAAITTLVGHVGSAVAQTRSFDNIEGIEIQIQPRTSDRIQPLTLPGAFDSAFYDNRSNFYYRTSRPGLVESLFGLQYPEQGIIDDSASINRVYRDAMNQQMTSDPFIRTRDIKNVYESSILTLPFAGGETSPFATGGFR
ncbi:MAG: hypothetical protein WBB29_04800 [Geitlerinemataceae cyanobacterium]